MQDVQFTFATVSRSNVIAGDYAGQDLEGQTVGPVVPFTYSVQFGFVSFGYDFISPTPSSFNPYDSQDFEALADGTITKVPGTVTPELNPPIILLDGIITQIINAGEEDFESYADGSITQLTKSTSLGDVEMGTGEIY